MLKLFLLTLVFICFQTINGQQIYPKSINGRTHIIEGTIDSTLFNSETKSWITSGGALSNGSVSEPKLNSILTNAIVKYYADTTALKAETNTEIKQAYVASVGASGHSGRYNLVTTTSLTPPDRHTHFASAIAGKTWKRETAINDAAYYGFTPYNTASGNVVALQNALDAGGKINVYLKGTYQFNKFFRIYSNTELIFGKGIYLSKMSGDSSKNTFINAAAFSGGLDSNIIIRGLTIKTNGLANSPSKGDSLYAVRGELSFHQAKNIKVYNYTVRDLGTFHWGVGLNDVDNFLLQDFEIRGQKDGIMIQNTTNFVLRNGVISTYDDRISLRGGDYPGVARTLGDTDGGIIENVRSEPYPGQSGYFVRIIPSAWVDWYSGMTVRTGDVVKNGNNVYQVINGTTTPVASTVAPTGGSRAFTTSDGIEWKFCQSDGARSATVKNIVFRNCEINSDGRPGIFSSPLEDTYMRAVYPDTVAPLVDNIVFENLIDRNLDNNQLFWIYNSVNMKIINPVTRRLLFEMRTQATSKNIDSKINVDRWNIDYDLYNPSGGDFVIADTMHNVFFNINTTYQKRDIKINKGLAVYQKIVSFSGSASLEEAFGLKPVAGDKIRIRNKERLFDGTRWTYPGRRAILLEVDPTLTTTFTAYLQGTSGKKIFVDFGDGTIEEYGLIGSTNTTVTHTYSGTSVYDMLIYGDLDDLTKLALINYNYGVYFDAGQVSDLIGLNILQLEGNDELQGDLSLLKNLKNLTMFRVFQSSLAGDLNVIANLPTSCNYVYAYGMKGDVYYTSATLKAWTNIDIRMQDNGLTSAEVDQILIDLAAASVASSTSSIRLDGTNAARTTASDAAVTTLTSNGWTVTVN